MTLHKNSWYQHEKSIFFRLKVRYARILVKLSLSYDKRDIQLWSDLLHINFFSIIHHFKLTQIPSPIRVKNTHQQFGMPLEMQRNIRRFSFCRLRLLSKGLSRSKIFPRFNTAITSISHIKYPT